MHFKLTLVEYIAQNSSLQFYLDKLDVSQSTLQIATKKVFNKTPKALLDESLILRAKRMLADPCKRIQEISFDLGFSEHTNFTKFFKRHTGHTPDSYRNMIISSNK